MRPTRRSFLRGLGGVVVGLPFLESIASRSWAGGGEAPRRLVIFFQCNGVQVSRFWPARMGPLEETSFSEDGALLPLLGYRERLLLPRGIHSVPRGQGRDVVPGDEHGKGMGHRLTASPLVDAVNQFASGISVDQEVARHVHPEGQPALALFVGDDAGAGIRHVSYRGPGDPVAAENDPWLAYQDLVGLSGADAAARERILARRQSVLDLVSEERAALGRLPLGRADRDKLDLHFTALRDLERGLATMRLPYEVVTELSALDRATVGADETFPVVGRLQLDVLALALASDATRVATLQWGAGAAGPVFRWDGMDHRYNHHKISHGNTHDDGSGDEIPGWETMQLDIDRWYAARFRDLLDRLDGYGEGEGTVLDHSAVVWLNEMSDGHSHDYRDLPIVIAGSCGGYFRNGHQVAVASDIRSDAEAPHNKLLTMFCQAMGVRGPDDALVTRFGAYGEDGIFTELLA